MFPNLMSELDRKFREDFELFKGIAWLEIQIFVRIGELEEEEREVAVDFCLFWMLWRNLARQLV